MSKKNNTSLKTEISNLIANKYLDFKKRLCNNLVKKLSIKQDDLEDLVHNAIESLLSKDFLTVEKSIEESVLKYLFSKTKFNAISFLNPRYNNEYNKTNSHLALCGIDSNIIDDVVKKDLLNISENNKYKIDPRLINETCNYEDAKINSIIKKLTIEELELVELYFYDNLSFRKIAKKFGSVDKIIRNKLKKIITKISQLEVGLKTSKSEISLLDKNTHYNKAIIKSVNNIVLNQQYAV